MVVQSLRGWEERVTRAAAAAGLSPVSAWALVQLDPDDPISQKELAARLHCNPSTVVDPTDRLEECGLVMRNLHPTDRRVKILTVTRRGAEVREELIRQLLAPPEAFGRISAADLAGLREVLIEALKSVEAGARDPAPPPASA